MRDKCLSERSYSYGSRMVQALLASLCSIWARDGRSANPEDWRGDGESCMFCTDKASTEAAHCQTEYQKRPHQHWGQLLTAAEVKIDWHTPSEAEVDFALEILKTVVDPAVERLEALAGTGQTITKEWRNDFNRYNSLVRGAMAGVSSLTAVTEPAEPGEAISDIG